MWATSEAFRAALTAPSRRWRNKIEVMFAGEVMTVLDGVVGGEVDFDSVAVRRAFRGTLSDPDGLLTPADAKDLLSPRGTELRVSRGLELADGTVEYVPLCVVQVVDPEITAHASGTLINLVGHDRVYAVRQRRFHEPYRVASGTPTHEAIVDVVLSRFNVPTRVAETGHTTPELLFDALSDPWDAVRSIASADGLTAYFDPLGTLVVGPDVTVQTGVSYAPGEGSFLIDSKRTLSAEHAYSGVVVRVEHPDRDPIVSIGWDLDPSSPTYADGPFGRRPYGFSSPVITTQAQADAARDTILQRVTRMQQVAELRHVGHPGHDVGDVVEIIDPDLRTTGRWVVRGGTVPLRAGQSTLKLEQEGDL